MGMQTGMDRAASWGEAVWRVWEDAPEPVRYGALCIIAIYAIWLVLFFIQRRILYFTDPTRIHPSDCELDRTEETELGTKYDEICGAMEVEFRGEEYTMPQMGRFMQDNDREVRCA